MKKRIKKLYSNNLLSRMENNEFVVAMRRGLLLCIPFLILGSFCIVFTSFPIPEYKDWIQSVFNGMLYDMITWVQDATIGSITLYVILGISYSYGKLTDKEDLGFYIFTSVVTYIVFAEEGLDEVSIFDSTWLFTGIILTLLSCRLLKKLLQLSKRNVKSKYQGEVDIDFYNTVLVIIPIVCVVLIFAAVKMLFVLGIGVNIQNIGSFLMMKLFGIVGTRLFGAVIYVFLSHALWFFGIHGSNMLSMVSEKLFEAGMFQNMEIAANGGEAVHIFTKTFIDVFVLMGGSGATLCLLFALLLCKRKKNKMLFKVGIIPALFNINEIVLFGLPVIFNPIMVIPFIIVPLVLMGVSASAMYIGLVPIPMVQVPWTTPVLFSGYLSTGSMAGAVLQIVLLFIGAGIYTPFIRISEFYYNKLLQKNVDGLKEEILECEKKGEPIDLTAGPRSKRDIVKMLTKDLGTAIENNEIMLYYQPQITSGNSIYGVEALLRWKHPVAGFLYPPLVIELARQENMLDELGIFLIEKAAKDLEYLASKINKPIHMAVNVSPVQFESEFFCEKVEEILNKYDFKDSVMCFEVTEQLALSTSEEVTERIERLKKSGIPFHMDDFGMGHSSMKYLQSNEFEAVKLDGSLVRQMMDNGRSKNIISGIQNMAHPLNYELIAEYVETEEQKKMLKELGCNIYQGTLYSWPIPMEKLEEFLKKYNAYK